MDGADDKSGEMTIALALSSSGHSHERAAVCTGSLHSIAIWRKGASMPPAGNSARLADIPDNWRMQDEVDRLIVLGKAAELVQ